MTALKLVAFDEVDLNVIAANLQDAVVQVADMTYLPRERRFVAVVSRFDWAASERSKAAAGKPELLRRRTGIRFENVEAAQVTGIEPREKSAVLSLLTITFEAQKPPEPEGHILLLFSGQAAVRLKVEAIEVEMRDLEAAWSTKSVPKHDLDATAAESAGRKPVSASEKPATGSGRRK